VRIGAYIRARMSKKMVPSLRSEAVARGRDNSNVLKKLMKASSSLIWVGSGAMVGLSKDRLLVFENVFKGSEGTCGGQERVVKPWRPT
jgi:hypothetical protein